MKLYQSMFLLIIIPLLPYAVYGYPRRVTQILEVYNGGRWGWWGPPRFCGKGTYAVGYNMKIERPDGDDTSLNAISLRCERLRNSDFGGLIESGVGIWGDWRGEERCKHKNALTAFSLQVEAFQGNGDDTAANWIKFTCRSLNHGNSYELNRSPGHGYWGRFGGWSKSCPLRSAICGIQTAIEHPQCDGDDTALNDVKFFCCSD